MLVSFYTLIQSPCSDNTQSHARKHVNAVNAGDACENKVLSIEKHYAPSCLSPSCSLTFSFSLFLPIYLSLCMHIYIYVLTCRDLVTEDTWCCASSASIFTFPSSTASRCSAPFCVYTYKDECWQQYVLSSRACSFSPFLYVCTQTSLDTYVCILFNTLDVSSSITLHKPPEQGSKT